MGDNGDIVHLGDDQHFRWEDTPLGRRGVLGWGHLFDTLGIWNDTPWVGSDGSVAGRRPMNHLLLGRGLVCHARAETWVRVPYPHRTTPQPCSSTGVAEPVGRFVPPPAYHHPTVSTNTTPRHPGHRYYYCDTRPTQRFFTWIRCGLLDGS